eukprot:scaffold36717_cov309-Isochrysis_galbana.AAC.1
MAMNSRRPPGSATSRKAARDVWVLHHTQDDLALGDSRRTNGQLGFIVWFPLCLFVKRGDGRGMAAVAAGTRKSS